MFKLTNTYQPPHTNLWQGREDSLPNERFFQCVTCHDLSHQPLHARISDNALVLLGFACDVGIKRNLGQPGAAQGPDALRSQLARLALHEPFELIDIGNIICIADDLASAQLDLANLVTYVQQLGYKTLILGGGHEIAWGHYLGLAPVIANQKKFGIINFDAHFDMRTCPKPDYSTSGSSFLQIAAQRIGYDFPFHYCCIGIQPTANTPSLFETATRYQVPYLTALEVNQLSVKQQQIFISDFLAHLEMVYLSVCLDVFSHSYAPGVSAPQACGLTPWQVIPLLYYIIQSGKVVSIDIAELSPPRDENGKTARLAAQLVAEMSSQMLKINEL